MSTSLTFPNLETYPTASIKISDINAPSQPHADSTTSRISKKTPSLEDLDNLFGRLQFGEVAISRKELHALGATLNGEAITPTTTYFAQPDQTFIDALAFDPVHVEQRIKQSVAQDGHLVPTLLFEIVTQRSVDAGPLLHEMPPGDSAAQMNKIRGVLNSAQRLDIYKSALPEHLPDWVDKTKSRSMVSMGAGLQAFGLYSAYRGAVDALKEGNMGEVFINAGGGAAEIGSLALEYAMTKTGESMIRNGATSLQLFAGTTMGRALCRSAGLIASVLTLPFDLYTAIKSFNDAAKAEGKAAQDLYVTGGLSVLSAGLSLMLGCAALMGFKAAGPVGLAAAAVMIVGARVYGAARMVDDIDDYIELSVNERWRAGWFAFTGQTQDQALMDRFTLARTYSDYAKALESTSTGWLNNELRDSVEAVVNGHFEVTLQPARVYRYQWDEALGELPYTTVNAPVINETDDIYDARDGLPGAGPSIVIGQTDPAKGVFWQLGGGNDTVQGVRDKPNYFNYGPGKKRLSGGEKDDSFLFHSASEALDSAPSLAQISTLQGGSGEDLLWLQGNHVHRDHVANPPLYVGYDIDLMNGKLGLRSADSTVDPVLLATIDSIEKVETLAGAANRVVGTDQAEVIAANGTDRILAGGGDDQVSIRGSHCTVDGASGMDTYYLDRMSHRVSISEDGQEHSIVHLGVPLESVQSWRIRNHALVIDSIRDEDPRLPERELIIEAVYQTLDGTRLLGNDKWTFITQDGYHLRPDWPAKIAGLTEHPVNVIVVTPGAAKTSPIVLNSRPVTVPMESYSYYFVSRDNFHTTLRAGQNHKENGSTLYIDFDSSEMAEVRATYTVTSTQKGAFNVLSYTDLYFTLIFIHGGGLLSLHGGVIADPARYTNRGPGILAAPWKINHNFTLVMRDGRSYWLDFPQNSFRLDAANPGYHVIQSRASLRERAGTYTFVKPSLEKHVLKTTPQRIDFRSEPHRATYWLEGRAATYDIYPTSNTSMQLSTAKADAAANGSSTWNIHTQHLQEPIDRQQLSLKNNLLKIGSIHIYLPDSQDPLLPLETVDVAIASGDRYRINTLFETISLHTLNALNFSTPQAIAANIHRHKNLDELDSNQVHIQHLHLRDATPGTIYYNAETGSWNIDSDQHRIVESEQLLIGLSPLPASQPG